MDFEAIHLTDVVGLVTLDRRDRFNGWFTFFPPATARRPAVEDRPRPCLWETAARPTWRTLRSRAAGRHARRRAPLVAAARGHRRIPQAPRWGNDNRRPTRRRLRARPRRAVGSARDPSPTAT